MRPVELMEVLEARERRVRRQQELLRTYGYPLISFTMNIAGPIKNSNEITWGFQYGSRLLLRQLERVKAPILHRESSSDVTGNEALFVVDFAPDRLKALMVELEDHLEIGRLFDMDVLDPDGQKLERSAERCCIICGAPGKGCARSRAHSVAALQERTAAVLKCAREQWEAEIAGELACRALLYEACTTPKPGLVDCANSGSHRDMDLFTFLSSAAALQPYFSECTQIGIQTANLPPDETFARLRWPGKKAELRMLNATNGINTHKGAIFTLGVLCGALGRLSSKTWKDPAAILRECAAMTAGLSDRELKTVRCGETAGERLYLQFGAFGIRGQIEAGLPAVSQVGLPALEKQLASGKTLEEAGCFALVALMSAVEDTNVLNRGGMEAQKWVFEQAAEISSVDDLKMLDAAMIAKNLSPGGAADLLAVCYFLHFLKNAI